MQEVIKMLSDAKERLEKFTSEEEEMKFSLEAICGELEDTISFLDKFKDSFKRKEE